jgi:hypothetical protein
MNDNIAVGTQGFRTSAVYGDGHFGQRYGCICRVAYTDNNITIAFYAVDFYIIIGCNDAEGSSGDGNAVIPLDAIALCLCGKRPA